MRISLAAGNREIVRVRSARWHRVQSEIEFARSYQMAVRTYLFEIHCALCGFLGAMVVSSISNSDIHQNLYAPSFGAIKRDIS